MYLYGVLMAEQADRNHNASDEKTPNGHPHKKTSSRSLWILFIVFFAFVAIVFLTQHKGSINWVEDYNAGIELAKKQNKPLLLAFYKLNTRFTTDMFQNTYNNPDVKKYVEENFVPVLIDVDKQPDIARLYNISYYPAHYIKRPDSDKLFGPRVGYDPPGLFISELKSLLNKMQSSDK
jgi:hypothetical protein